VTTSFAGLPGERFENLRCDARPEPFDRILGARCVSWFLDDPALTVTSGRPYVSFIFPLEELSRPEAG
jgi:hypothetical protein